MKSINSGIYPVIRHLIQVSFGDSEETLGYSGVQIREKILLPLSLLLPIGVPCTHLSLECLHLANNHTWSCDVWSDEKFPASCLSVALTLSPVHCQVELTRPASRKLWRGPLSFGMHLVGLQPPWPALLSLGRRFESRSGWLSIL